MRRPRYENTEGIVLRQTPWGEGGTLLVLYTPGRGKVRAVARGARRSRSHMVGHLEPLTRVALSLTPGRGLEVVTGGQAIESHRALREDLGLLACGTYCAELVDAFNLEEEPSTPLYHQLRLVLEDIATWPDPALAVRYFEFRLLDLVGYRPELFECVSCRSPLSPGRHAFALSAGGLVCPSCSSRHHPLFPVSLTAVKVLRLFVRGDRQDVARLRLAPGTAGELERALGSYVTTLLQREVKSARFLRQVSRADLDRRRPAGAPAGGR